MLRGLRILRLPLLLHLLDKQPVSHIAVGDKAVEMEVLVYPVKGLVVDDVVLLKLVALEGDAHLVGVVLELVNLVLFLS